jgi:hypothetical protein
MLLNCLCDDITIKQYRTELFAKIGIEKPIF